MDSKNFNNEKIFDESDKIKKVHIYNFEPNIGEDKIMQSKIKSNCVKKYTYIIFYLFFASIFFSLGMLLQRYKNKNKLKKISKTVKLNKIKNSSFNTTNSATEIIMNKIYKFTSKKKISQTVIVLYSIFHDVEKGFYIDVGANDPNSASVTREFYNRGWHGINIEPVPYLYKLLLKYRPNDINVGMAVGDRDDKVTLYMTPNNYQSSTVIKNNRNDYTNDTKTTIVNMTTMIKICNKYITNETINFLKIDVEGSEKNVILGYDFEKYRPQVIAIEYIHWVRGKTIKVHKNWENILIQKNFSFVYKTYWDRFYADNKIPGLKEKFQNVGYYIKRYFLENKHKYI